MRRALPLVAVLALFVILAAGTGGVAATDAAVAETAADCETEADNELVGCWNGTYHADEFGIDQEDGLTEAELEALTQRSMARVEYLRERPFETGVPVETVTREEFRSNGTGNGSSDAGEEFDRWNDQVWEALFVVGENESSAEAIDTVFGGSVTGFYSPADDRIVLVIPEGEEVRVSESTLVHELTHAMQDQYHDLTEPRYVGATQDADLAVDGVIEGEAVHVEERYDERCGTNWSCLEEPESSTGGGGAPNFGILQTVLQPYSDGPFYVAELRDEGGWDAVNETMNDPPNTTSEVIHREPDYETREVDFEDTAEGGWETYPEQGVNGAETAGEASMFVMFWYQSFAEAYEYPVLEPDESAAANVRVHTDTDDRLRTRSAYNYAHPATTGWAGDELYPYRNDAGGTERDGYVWVTEWRTPTDARQFQRTYRTMLEAHGAERRDDGVHEIASGDFRGAYGVEREGTTVTIVHGPEPADVPELRPGIDLDPLDSDDADDGTNADGDVDDGTNTDDDADGGTNGEDDVDGTDGDGDVDDGSETGSTDGDDPTDDGSTIGRAPGFGTVVAVVALLSLTVVLGRRSRR